MSSNLQPGDEKHSGGKEGGSRTLSCSSVSSIGDDSTQPAAASRPTTTAWIFRMPARGARGGPAPSARQHGSRGGGTLYPHRTACTDRSARNTATVTGRRG